MPRAPPPSSTRPPSPSSCWSAATPRRRSPGSAPTTSPAAGHAHLHPDAQRPRRHRMRPHRRPPRRGRATTSSPAPASPRTTSHWIARNIPDGLDARLTDVTSAYAVLALMGPRARDMLPRCRRRPLQRRLPLRHRAGASPSPARRCMALRITYVGELGWELHIPVEFAASVYDALMAAGKPYGIANAGYRAIESLRLEKGYRAWGADIGPDHSPLMAGLGLAMKLRTNIPFLGREALEAQARGPLPRLLAGFTSRPRGRAARARDHLSRRQARRLARQRRLRLYGRPDSATATCATRRTALPRGGAVRPLRARGRQRARAGGGVPRAALRSRDGAHQGLIARSRGSGRGLRPK